MNDDHVDDNYSDSPSSTALMADDTITRGKRRRQDGEVGKYEPQSLDEQNQYGYSKRNKVDSQSVLPLKADELYVDWGSLVNESATSSWIKQPFINHNLPIVEIDKLIGYSTHVTTYHRINIEGRAEGENLEEKRLYNRLLGLPSIPLRPTLVKHLILDRATKLTNTYIDESVRLDDSMKGSSSDDSDDDNDDEDDNEEFIIQDDGNIDKKVAERRARKIKLQNRKRKEVREKKNRYQHLYERFHHSASIAIGMIIEEMVTASLLSLAQQHVHRCRYIVNDDGRSTNCNEFGISEWTLPPEEAIVTFSNDKFDNNCDSSKSLLVESSSLISACIPARSIVPGAVGTSTLNQPNMGEHERVSYNNWCQSRFQKYIQYKKIIENDASFFQLLIPNIPSSTSIAHQHYSTTSATNDSMSAGNSFHLQLTENEDNMSQFTI